MKQLQPKYYIQFQGDVADLASEYFTQFMTPKGRGACKETLLDKFDPSTTSLAYLVKVCVTRKLIDSSRCNPHTFVSIDDLLDEHGDMITAAFDLIQHSEEYETAFNDKRFLRKVLKAYNKLTEEQRNAAFVPLFESESPLCKVFKPIIRYIHQCPVQQVTEKAVVLYVPGTAKCITFSKSDGHPRGLIKPFHLTAEECANDIYHSQFSVESFTEYCQSL